MDGTWIDGWMDDMDGWMNRIDRWDGIDESRDG